MVPATGVQNSRRIYGVGITLHKESGLAIREMQPVLGVRGIRRLTRHEVPRVETVRLHPSRDTHTGSQMQRGVIRD